jgi:hypothetical protein
MEGYCDITRSSELGKYYVKSLYVNLATAIKKEIDAEVDRSGLALARRQEVLQLYDALAIVEDYDKVDQTEFYELSERIRNDRKRAKVDQQAVLAQSYTSLGPPPKKAPVQSSPGSASPA